jgi:hypothetical protein
MTEEAAFQQTLNELPLTMKQKFRSFSEGNLTIPTSIKVMDWMQGPAPASTTTEGFDQTTQDVTMEQTISPVNNAMAVDVPAPPPPNGPPPPPPQPTGAPARIRKSSNRRKSADKKPSTNQPSAPFSAKDLANQMTKLKKEPAQKKEKPKDSLKEAMAESLRKRRADMGEDE